MREYLKFYINGEWVDPVTPKTLDVINPANEQVAGHISMGSAADVDKAAKAARWLGYVGFDRIHDGRNDPPDDFTRRGSWDVTDCHIDLVVSDPPALPWYQDYLPSIVSTGNDTPSQPYLIVFLGEKSSLADVLRQIAREHQAELILPTGEFTDTLIFEMAARADADGRPLVVLYFSIID